MTALRNFRGTKMLFANTNRNRLFFLFCFAAVVRQQRVEVKRRSFRRFSSKGLINLCVFRVFH